MSLKVFKINYFILLKGKMSPDIIYIYNIELMSVNLAKTQKLD